MIWMILGTCDLQDLYDLRYFCMVWRICKILILGTCLHHVYPGWVYMRRKFHTCVLECYLCDLYTFTGLNVHDLQDLHHLPN